VEADWEVEIGGGAPVIETLWPGFVDLRSDAGRGGEIGAMIAEAAAFAPLGDLLRALNGRESPVWTSKCDLWEPEPAGLAIYIDMLPREGTVFAEWRQGEEFCRKVVARLEAIALEACGPDCRIDLVIRQAIAGGAEGFGITAYLSTTAGGGSAAAAMAAMMAGFLDALCADRAGAASAGALRGEGA
jgi:hypothetical protein